MSSASYKRISRKAKIVNGCDVYISKEKKYAGWNLKRSKWAIPSEIEKKPLSQRQALYKEYLIESGLINDIPELVHQLLGCWCEREDQCHVSVLKEFLDDYMSSPPDADDTNFPRMRIDRVPIYKARPRKQRAVLRSVRSSPSVSPSASSIAMTTNLFNDNIESIPYGSIPLSVVMKFPIVIREVVPYTPPPLDVSDFTEPSSAVITKGCISGLKNGDYTSRGWPDFYCKVAKIIKDSKTSRFALHIAENDDNTLRVELASQLFELASLRYINKGDTIHVIDYAITNLYPDRFYPDDENEFNRPKPKSKKKSKVYFVTNLKILTECESPFPR